MNEVWEAKCRVCGKREYVFGCPNPEWSVCLGCQKNVAEPPVETLFDGWSWVAITPEPVVKTPPDRPSGDPPKWLGEHGVAPPKRPDIVKVHNFIESRDNDKDSKLRALDEAIAIASGDDLKWLLKERDRVEGRYPADFRRQFVEEGIACMLGMGYAVRVFGGNQETVKLTTDCETILAGMMTTSRDTVLFYCENKDAPALVAVFDYPFGSPPTVSVAELPRVLS